jgi:hypothetical protein
MLNVNVLTPVFDDFETEDDFVIDADLAMWEADVYDVDPTGGSPSRY